MNDEDALILAEQFKLTSIGLIIKGQPSFEDWELVGKQLKFMEKTIHWAIGDWLNYGEQQWGEAASQALEALDYTDGTMANDKYIAKAIPASRRRENLTFSHHREVASLAPDKQDKILDMAEKKRLTTKQVRQIARAERSPIEPDYQRLVYDIIERIDTLAEVYPPGIQQIKDYVEGAIH